MLGATAPSSPPAPADGTAGPTVTWSVRAGDSLQVLPTLPAASVDAIVCDPPYGIDFQGQAWDGRSIRAAARDHAGRRLSASEAFEQWATAWALECARVLKPGGHFAGFGAPRTFHRLVSGLEDAGLEIRDVLLWLYGTGMPKSRRLPGGQATALKPAYEPILLARKPPLGSVQCNLHAYGTGALNVDACHVEGRWPANVVLSHAPNCRDECCQPTCAVALIDAAAGDARVAYAARRPVSRLFYCPKATRRERNAGCEHLPHQRLDLFPTAADAAYTPPTAPNAHPTVKPLALMRWLVRLATPPGGTVLDPFCGSGSTGCAAVLEDRRFLGIERNEQYAAVARARIAHWTQAVRSSEAPR